MENNIKYSVVVPVYNEEDNVQPLFQEIKEVMLKLNEPFEIIFVNDGSSDSTHQKLKTLSPIKIIAFRRNFGQTSALDAGIKHSQGDFIITLDGDGQNPPAEIPKLIEKIKQGYDVVSGWRYNRKDNLSKRIISRGADFLRKLFVKDKIHDSGCTLKIYKKKCFKDIQLMGETHRFIPAMLRWQGFKLGEIKVEHLPRKRGYTKYTWKRVLKGFIDMLSVWFYRKYTGRPLHLFGGLGIIIGGGGFMMGLYLAIARYFFGYSLQDRIWPLVSIFMVLVGIQLFISGLLADISVKNHYQGKKNIYNIKEIIEN